MQPGHTLDALRDPDRSEPVPVLVLDKHVMMRLSPVMTHEHPHAISFPLDAP
jgi:hypothetical protein